MTSDEGTLTVKLGVDLKRRFKMRCAEEGETMTERVVEAVKGWVGE